MNKGKEVFMRNLMLAAAFVAVFTILLIAFFILREGLPVFLEYGFLDIITGTVWNPTKYIYGILPMIVGTFYVTFLALLIGVPTGLATAVYLADFAGKTGRVIRPAIELLAGIPSVLYGLFGMVAVNQVMRWLQRDVLAGAIPREYTQGYSVISGAIVLAIMILPTMINISEDAIKAVPVSYKQGSLALGGTHIQTIFKVVLPAARSGIISAIILAMGRALGETMALIMVLGNSALLPKHGLWSIFAPISSLTGTIALEMGYAGPDHRAALFAIGIVLFVIIGILNGIAWMFTGGKGAES